MAHRRYSEDDKAAALAALAANSGNVFRTAQQLDIPQGTLRRWAAGEGINDAVAQKREQKKGELREELKSLAVAITGAMEAKIAAADLRDAAVALGIVADKYLALKTDTPSAPAAPAPPPDLSLYGDEEQTRRERDAARPA